jgi:hypothetical protein
MKDRVVFIGAWLRVSQEVARLLRRLTVNARRRRAPPFGNRAQGVRNDSGIV